MNEAREALAMTPQIFFEDVSPRTAIAQLVVVPTAIQLFRFSAVTWNAHRIHYDRGAASAEGHPDVLVQAHLHGAFLARVVTDWMGPQGRLRAIEWRNRGRAVPGDTLTISAMVQRTYVVADEGRVELSLSEMNQREELCASGAATVTLPFRRLASAGSSHGPSGMLTA